MSSQVVVAVSLTYLNGLALGCLFVQLCTYPSMPLNDVYEDLTCF